MRLPPVFGMCQSVETGVEEKEKEKKQTKEEDPLGREGGHLARCLKRRKKEAVHLGGPEDCESASCT